MTHARLTQLLWLMSQPSRRRCHWEPCGLREAPETPASCPLGSHPAVTSPPQSKGRSPALSPQMVARKPWKDSECLSVLEVCIQQKSETIVSKTEKHCSIMGPRQAAGSSAALRSRGRICPPAGPRLAPASDIRRVRHDTRQGAHSTAPRPSL